MNHPTSGPDPTGTGTDTGVGTDAGVGAGTGVSAGSDVPADTGQVLREVFAGVAYDFTPPPVPLEAIERDGRRLRRRRRAAALSTGCGLLLIPLVVLGLRLDGPSSTVQPMTPPRMNSSASPSPTPTPPSTPTRSTATATTAPPSAPLAGQVRVVAPGERVRTEYGSEFWLTAEGKHWTDPEPEPGVPPMKEFRSVVDGNLDTSEPGLSMQGSGSATQGYLVSGLFYGVRSAAAGVRITAYDGEVIDGTVLRLKGNTRWGVWYGRVRPPEDPARSPDFEDPVRKVSVYDTDGGVLAEMDFGT
ncbi:hypothetical protein ACWD26_39375 [Streptomyces sp. NPDC002787]